MLAESRTANVIGRIIVLMVSMQTINAISCVGVPRGSMCDSMCLVFINHPNRVKLIHSVKASESVVVMWLVEVNEYGRSPLVFLTMMNHRIENGITFSPFGLVIFIACNSLQIFILMMFVSICCCDGIIHSDAGRIIIGVISLTQLNDVLNDVAGSNVENKLIIIVS
jgi:hypothetical protein